jgi:phage FluMu protein Com
MKIIIRIIVTLFIVMIADSIVGRLIILALTNGGLENPDTIWSWSIVRVAVTLWCGIKWGWNNPRLAPKKRVIDVSIQKLDKKCSNCNETNSVKVIDENNASAKCSNCGSSLYETDNE